ncbi:MAG: ABC transporter ATP-binding protein [Firmicutes bacterium]|nr:ABC transporter ATP-binding protein [Bacillota bacterium]
MDLKLAHVRVDYGETTIIHDVSLTLRRGMSMALVGPNGAGKTTLLHAISGHRPLRAGRVTFAGQDVTRWSVDQRARIGIGRSFQGIHLFPHLTALASVTLAVAARQGTLLGRLFSRVPRQWVEEAHTYLAQTALSHQANKTASAMSHGDKRKLELAMLLALRPAVLLLDEPTAGMALAEVPTMLALLEEIKASGAYAILLVEHKLDVVFRLCDEVVVLQQGSILAQGSARDVMADERVQAAYLGGTHGDSA